MNARSSKKREIPLRTPENEEMGLKSDPLSKEFIDYLGDGKNYSPQTLRSYRQALGQFRDFRPSLEWKAATADDFRAYLFDLMKRDAHAPRLGSPLPLSAASTIISRTGISSPRMS